MHDTTMLAPLSVWHNGVVAGGVVFGVAWSLFADASLVQHGLEPPVYVHYAAPGVLASVFVVLALVAPVHRLDDQAPAYSRRRALRVCNVLFCGLMLGFAALMAAAHVARTVYYPLDADPPVEHHWPGAALVGQSALLLVAALVVVRARLVRA